MRYIFGSIFLTILLMGCQNGDDYNFASQWHKSDLTRNWAGNEYWLNPLQSWKQDHGVLNCEASGGDRNVVLLTRELNDQLSDFEMLVKISPIDSESTAEEASGNDIQNTTPSFPVGLSSNGWVGFQLGLQGQFNDYRDDAIKGIGLCAGLTTDGYLFIGDLMHSSQIADTVDQELVIQLLASVNDSFTYNIVLAIEDDQGQPIGSFNTIIHKTWLVGMVALTCSQSIPDPMDYTLPKPGYSELKPLNRSMGGNTSFSFSEWKIKGDKIDDHEKRAYGPILWTQHTLSDNIMKMSVQMAPVGNDNKEVQIFVDGVVEATAVIDEVGRNAIFRIEEWDSTIDHNYSIRYNSKDGSQFNYDGTIKKDPFKTITKVASLSCVDDRGFPHQDIVDNVMSHDPDIYVFHGDQLYERVAGYGVERNSFLDYLRKWYIFGWSFSDALRNTPSIIIPDDHDVFHGNLWGEGGKKANTSLGYGYDSQDDGGYKEPPEFVNMVHRTQTGHLPDPFDPSPVKQGISVYYTNLNYGGISFAILGDRQWKSAPKALLPEAKIENGWPQNKSWNAKTQAGHPNAELLGLRQESFLERWVSAWAPGIAFKSVISQSPFCNVATLPADLYHDKYVPGLPKYKKGEYPPDDRPVADFDSNAWPQNKRNKAVSIMKKAAAIHITGDQHLGSTGQYGVEEWGDAGFWVATPAVSNLWPRRWFPAQEAQGGKRFGDSRKYTGNYEDGFGNKITVRGIANPHDIDREPSMVYDKAPGYTIIDFDRIERTIKIAVWPRWASPTLSAPDNVPFSDWPIVIDQEENLGNAYPFTLEPLDMDGNTLVKVYDNATREMIYSYRPKQGLFRAPVPNDKEYYIMAYDKEGNKRMHSSMNVQ